MKENANLTMRLLSDTECQEITGGFFPALFLAGTITAITIPVAKSIWNSTSGSIKLPSGIEAKWEDKTASSLTDNKDMLVLKKAFNKLEQNVSHLIPPFYEF